MTRAFCLVNTIAADGLATEGATESTGMGGTDLSWNLPVFHIGGVNYQRAKLSKQRDASRDSESNFEWYRLLENI